MDSYEKSTTLRDPKSEKSENIPTPKYNAISVVGSGSFGVVYQAECMETGKIVAIKKVFQDKRYKNRELHILKELDHINVIKMNSFFYTNATNKDECYLNVVMDYFNNSLSKIIKKYTKGENQMPNILIKLYSYQMLRALYYIQLKGICHRDIKPQNILVDDKTHLLQLCDFGSAKKLTVGETNVAYICSRFYRAPELVFNAVDYSTNIDVWSIGCVIAELVLGKPIFAGDSSINQLVEIIKVIGTPSKTDIKKMNPNYILYKFPIIRSFTLSEIFKEYNMEENFLDLLRKILVYDPLERIKPLNALCHPFFDDLKKEKAKTPDGLGFADMLFNFSEEEKENDRYGLIDKIVPEWYKK
jgi:serine/threonine protein kinase